MSDQGQLFPRKWNVTVATNEGAGLDLSEFHIKFKVNQSDVETPNWCDVRIYNLSDETSTRLLGKEYDRVQISAGYLNGPYGVIFDGTVKQTRRGRENQIDTYLDILAADGDQSYNFSVVNQTLAAGSSPEDTVKALAAAMNLPIGFLSDFRTVGNPQISIRGKTLYGLAKEPLRNLAQGQNARWSIQNGRMVFLSNSGYIVAEAVALNSKTGMISIPEQTQSGIRVRALINPKFVIGQRVQINNADIQSFQTQPTQLPGAFATQTIANLFPSKAADGLYRIMVSEFIGDTRGNDWYSELICLAINAAVDPNSSVNPWP